MKRKIEDMIQLVSGMRMADRTRYCFLAVFLGCVHLLLTLVGFLLMCLPLAFTNLAVAALDFLSICGTKNSRSFFCTDKHSIFCNLYPVLVCQCPAGMELRIFYL